jgi:HEAT repeat protein
MRENVASPRAPHDDGALGFPLHDLERTAMRELSSNLGTGEDRRALLLGGVVSAPVGGAQRHPLRRVLPVALASALAALVPCAAVSSAHAAPGKPGPGKGRAQASLEEVAVMLSSNEEDEVRTALETAATLPAGDVLPMLEERIRGGLSRVLLDVAIDSMMLLDSKLEAPLLTDLARHRRPDVRMRALEVLSRLKAPTSEQVITRALGDPATEVRKAAADALAELGSRSSMPALERALKLGVDGAARALGRLAKTDDVPRLLEHVGNTPTAQLAPMFAALLARKDIPDADKLRSVEKLSGLGGDEASDALAELLAKLPTDVSARVRKALDEAVQKGKSE